MADNELKALRASVPGVPAGERFAQTGNDNVLIPNYGTVNINVQTPFGAGFYVPQRISREYYNIFVIGEEAFDRPYFAVPRERALNRYMEQETMRRFDALTPEMIGEIKTLPSLFLAENRAYGRAEDGQKAIYGFVSGLELREDDIKVSFCGYRGDIAQKRLNELLRELGLYGDGQYNELNRTHWAIKQADLIGVLQEAGIAVPVFQYGTDSRPAR